MNQHKILKIAIVMIVGALLWRMNPLARKSFTSTKSGQRVMQLRPLTISATSSNLNSGFAPKTVSASSPVSSTSPVPSPSSAKGHDLQPDEIFCRALQADTGIPMTGKLKIVPYGYDVDEDDSPGFVLIVQSSDCPAGLSSKVKMDLHGRVKQLIDCRNTTKEELATASGAQGNVYEVAPTTGNYPLAISGDGYFVMDCPEGLILSRSGNFKKDGNQLTQKSCHALAKDGTPFVLDGELDDEGCTPTGNCIARANPEGKSVRILDNSSFLATQDPFQNLAQYSKIFVGSLENLDDPAWGPTGPHWERLSEYTPPVHCPEYH